MFCGRSDARRRRSRSRSVSDGRFLKILLAYTEQLGGKGNFIKQLRELLLRKVVDFLGGVGVFEHCLHSLEAVVRANLAIGEICSSECTRSTLADDEGLVDDRALGITCLGALHLNIFPFSG